MRLHRIIYVQTEVYHLNALNVFLADGVTSALLDFFFLFILNSISDIFFSPEQLACCKDQPVIVLDLYAFVACVVQKATDSFK